MKNDLTPEIRQETKNNAVRHSTKVSYAHDLAVFKKYCDENNIVDPTVTDVMAYFDYSIERKKYATVRRYRASLAREYPELTTLEVRETINHKFKALRKNNPPNTKKSVPLTHYDYQKLMDLTVRKDYKLIFRLQWKSGARVSDILNLTVDDISYVKQKNGEDWVKLNFKSRKETDQSTVLGLQNSVDLGTWTNIHIQKNRLKPEDLMFPKVNRNVLRRHIQSKIGEQFGTHSMRSGHVNRALDNGHRESIIMKSTGHKNATNFVQSYVNPATCFDNSTDIED